jgi:cobalt transporter subunit CbtB
MQAQTIGARAGSRNSARSQRLMAAAMAVLFGGFLVWGVGFSPIDILHNAAHDTRHSMAFPCH